MIEIEKTFLVRKVPDSLESFEKVYLIVNVRYLIK